MRKLKVGDGYIILDDEELQDTPDEVTLDDLDLSRDEQLEYKRRVFRRNAPEHNKVLTKAYYDTRYYAKRKGVNFPMGKDQFIESLFSLPLEGEEGDTLGNVILLGKNITRISPQKEGMDIYYRDKYISTIVYSI